MCMCVSVCESACACVCVCLVSERSHVFVHLSAIYVKDDCVDINIVNTSCNLAINVLFECNFRISLQTRLSSFKVPREP